MIEKHSKGILKHIDFIVLDILFLQVSFVLVFWALRGFGKNPYSYPAFQFQAGVLFVGQLLIILFLNNYGGILRRKRFEEFIAILKYSLSILLIALLYLFLIHRANTASRLQIGFTFAVFLALDFLVRQLNKRRILRSSDRNNLRSLLLVTSSAYVEEAVKKLTGKGIYRDFFLSGIVLLDEGKEKQIGDLKAYQGPVNEIPVMTLCEETMEKIRHGWVDEVFILQPDDMLFPKELMNDLRMMGITVNYSMSAITGDNFGFTDIRKIGNYKVLTSSIRFASAGQLLIKRGFDIFCGLIGCLFTGLLTIFVGPAIYIKSPGPVFFSQNRVGRNGKVFKMYKFRSMYLDAEERKAALMAQNNISDGMMFKMDDDPRIIGSEKKGKNGKPKGIGNFIRNTSIDEFPQFYNVLKGDMSLIGWRPATLDEWEKYGLSHRVRASMKPGITGMWQVSGRSEIVDFDEVVKLDREYVEEWSILLDIKILLKTFVVVLLRKGAK